MRFSVVTSNTEVRTAIIVLDLYATTMLGKIITMISDLFGIAIVALPAGIVTAGYMEELQEMKKETQTEDKHD